MGPEIATTILDKAVPDWRSLSTLAFRWRLGEIDAARRPLLREAFAAAQAAPAPAPSPTPPTRASARKGK